MRLHRERLRERAAPEHLDETALGHEARAAECFRVDDRAASNASRISRFTTAYSTRNGLRNPFAFGVRLLIGV